MYNMYLSYLRSNLSSGAAPVKRDKSVLYLVKNPLILVCCVSVLFANYAFGSLDSTLELHLNQVRDRLLPVIKYKLVLIIWENLWRSRWEQGLGADKVCPNWGVCVCVKPLSKFARHWSFSIDIHSLYHGFVILVVNYDW